MTNENVVRIALLAEEYEIATLDIHCREYIVKNIDLQMCWEIYPFLDRDCFASIIIQVKNAIVKNSSALFSEEYVTQAPYELLEFLIQQENLTVPREESICDGIIKYYFYKKRDISKDESESIIIFIFFFPSSFLLIILLYE